MLKNHYRSIDFLRGLGVFFVLVLHTSFYYYADIYDVDIANPSLIITLIGFFINVCRLVCDVIWAVLYDTVFKG